MPIKATDCLRVLETYKLWSNLFRPRYSNHAGSLSHNCTWNRYHRSDKCSHPM